MTSWLAGETITDTALNDYAPAAESAACTPAASFTVSSFVVYKTAGVTWFSVQLTYSGTTITGSSSGNIPDTLCCTLPFAPQAEMWLPYAVSSAADGIVGVAATGACTLQTLTPTATIASGSVVTFSGIILTG